MNDHETAILIADVSHEASIMALVASQYSGTVSSREYWDWRYFRNRFADVRIFCAVDRSDRVIAMQAVTSFSAMRGSDQSGRFHLLTAAITHESFRRKGLFRKLIQRIQDDLIGEDADFAYTVPNSLSQKAFRKFGNWEAGRNLTWWLRPFRRRRPARNRNMNECIISRSSFSDDPLHAATVSAWYPGHWTINRSPDYLKGRFGPDAPFEYRLDIAEIGAKTTGYLITRSMRLSGINIAVIADIAAESEGVITKLLSHAAMIAAESGMSGVGLLCSPEIVRTGLLPACGYLPVPSWVIRRRFQLFYCHQDAPNRSETPRFRITMGDTDLV